MEPPVGSGADDLRDKKAEVFRSMPDANPAQYVRGQYQGYLDVDGVAKESTTETFAALRLEMDNWRWAGVPFFIRAGKAMATRVTEVRLVFRRPPQLRLHRRPLPLRAEPGRAAHRPEPRAADPGSPPRAAGSDAWQPVHLDMTFAQELGPTLEPYERLLSDAMVGDNHLFTREDAVEETWRIDAAAARQPAAGAPVRAGIVGTAGGGRARPRVCRLAQAVAARGSTPDEADKGGHDGSH